MNPTAGSNAPLEPEEIPAVVSFGREICGQMEAAEKREWLVTNGIGGFASGTVAGHLTRRYHGLLFAALHPPVGRTLLVAKVDETVRYNGALFPLATNRWASGVVEPNGYLNIEEFRLEGTTPVWKFALADALIEKRVWMQAGANTTFVQYRMLRGRGRADLDLKALVNYRDYHANTHAGGWQMKIDVAEGGCRVQAFGDAVPFFLRSGTARYEPAHEWCVNYDLAVERDRGLDDKDDHLHAANFRGTLSVGKTLTLVFSTDPEARLDGVDARKARVDYERALQGRWQSAFPKAAETAPAWIRQLILAADQFIVQRPLPEDSGGRSVIAGYHWFADWGRDTMVALAGLTLATGRPEVARNILRTYARFADGGMLPNNFPDAGSRPEYNAMDAALWYVEAVRQYFAETRDTQTLESLFPVLAGIIEAYTRGTRHQIKMDPGDGLVIAGAPGVQLTWMDARVGDRPVTPRTGKPVEVNALWHNALVTLAQFARALGKPHEPHERMAERTRQGFQRFWNSEAGCCFDVLDTPEGTNDASLRPNQIFAVSLPASPLTPEQQRGVVDVCARRLLTSYGLRSLAPGEPEYQGRYAGGPRERDAAYHQGTVWGWLLGPFVLAHLRVYQDPALAASFLEPMGHQLHSYGLGTLAEIYDGDPPFAPRGCIAQAWTVGEVLRAWHACQAFRPGT